MTTTNIRSITFCDLDDGATFVFKDEDPFGLGSLFTGTIDDIAAGLYIAWELEPVSTHWRNELVENGETLFSYHGVTSEMVKKVSDNYFTVQAV